MKSITINMTPSDVQALEDVLSILDHLITRYRVGESCEPTQQRLRSLLDRLYAAVDEPSDESSTTSTVSDGAA